MNSYNLLTIGIKILRWIIIAISIWVKITLIKHTSIMFTI